MAGEAAARRNHRRRYPTTTTTTSTPLTTNSPCLSEGVISNENLGDYCKNLEQPTSTTEMTIAPIRRKFRRRRRTTTPIPSTTNSPNLLDTSVQNKNLDLKQYDGLGSEMPGLPTDAPGGKNMTEDKVGV